MSTLLLLLLLSPSDRPVVVASKKFTESNLLAEMAVALCDSAGVPAQSRQIGGTQQVWEALVKGEVDAYPEYTGTLMRQIFSQQELRSLEELHAALRERGVDATAPLGFANPYVLGMHEETAARLGVTKISHLRDHPQLRLGFSNEFLDRDDGWPSLQRAYDLPHSRPNGMSHALAYRALDSGDIDVMDTYRTDAQNKRYPLRLLEDDLNHFPPYEAIFLYRLDLESRSPEAVEVIKRLEGAITSDEMLNLNAAVELDRRMKERAARDFLAEKLGVGEAVGAASGYERRRALGDRLIKTTREHVFLVGCALAMSIVVAVPLGVVAAKRPAASQWILSFAEVVQTIPGLALLAFLMPPVRAVGLPGTGPAPVIGALFLYSLLPIIRNTYTGLQDIPLSLRESAAALGLSRWEQLWCVELPLASRMILAGVKTTAVIIVGYATLGALIGAGGYGDPILSGMDAGRADMMMEGAIPAALLALGVKLLFEWAERHVVPRGLRVKAAH